MRIAVIVNVHSSRSEREESRIRRLFAARGLEIDGPHTATDAGSLRKMVRRAVKRKFDVVAIGGGDGSMTLAVEALAHRDTVLGVLPLGTGNSFAQTLGLTDDLEEAVGTIAQGRVARVDLGIVNKRYFANFATIGLPAEIAAAASHPLKKLLGTAAYVVGAVGPFFTDRPFDAKVRWESGQMRLRTRQIIIASGRFFGHQPLMPSATIIDGKLAFFTTTGLSRPEIVRAYLALAFGQQAHLPDAHMFMAKEITVRARPAQQISIDGEPCGSTPARFRVAPKALRVFVPPGFAAQAGG